MSNECEPRVSTECRKIEPENLVRRFHDGHGELTSASLGFLEIFLLKIVSGLVVVSLIGQVQPATEALPVAALLGSTHTVVVVRLHVPATSIRTLQTEGPGLEAEHLQDQTATEGARRARLAIEMEQEVGTAIEQDLDLLHQGGKTCQRMIFSGANRCEETSGKSEMDTEMREDIATIVTATDQRAEDTKRVRHQDSGSGHHCH